jgi:hypothetical protein
MICEKKGVLGISIGRSPLSCSSHFGCLFFSWLISSILGVRGTDVRRNDTTQIEAEQAFAVVGGID